MACRKREEPAGRRRAGVNSARSTPDRVACAVWELAPEAGSFCTAPEAPAAVLTAADTLDGGAALPGFALPLRDLFADLDRQGRGGGQDRSRVRHLGWLPQCGAYVIHRPVPIGAGHEQDAPQDRN